MQWTGTITSVMNAALFVVVSFFFANLVYSVHVLARVVTVSSQVHTDHSSFSFNLPLVTITAAADNAGAVKAMVEMLEPQLLSGRSKKTDTMRTQKRMISTVVSVAGCGPADRSSILRSSNCDFFLLCERCTSVLALLARCVATLSRNRRPQPATGRLASNSEVPFQVRTKNLHIPR